MRLGVYHGCHNSFVISEEANGDLSKIAKQYCLKYQTDGFITLKQNPLEMIYYNADGSRAPMCGNGIRCFAHFLYDLGLIKQDVVKIHTLGGIMEVEITSLAPFMVKVNLGTPDFSSSKLDINTAKEQFINEIVSIDNQEIIVTCVYLGTHHAVVFVDDITISDLGYKLCHYEKFIKQMNVNFVRVINRNEIFVKTFERGVGWTMACGTGASSSYVIARLLDKVDNNVICSFEGGMIQLETVNDMIIMEGPVEVIKELSNE